MFTLTVDVNGAQPELWVCPNAVSSSAAQISDDLICCDAQQQDGDVMCHVVHGRSVFLMV
jgi:hypothetical protein